VENNSNNYDYQNADLGWAHSYLLPVIDDILTDLKATKIFELGCGNGSVANWLHLKKIDIVGIDYSQTGIGQANKTFPDVRLEEGSAYENLRERFGQFPVVMSLEVVEHLYFPKVFAKNVFDLLEPDGIAVISTPFHGYWKNLALALTGKLDAHFTALWDGGHIKFWSENTLRKLLSEAGFIDIKFRRAGRFSVLAKSMIAIARKPSN